MEKGRSLATFQTSTSADGLFISKEPPALTRKFALGWNATA